MKRDETQLVDNYETWWDAEWTKMWDIYYWRLRHHYKAVERLIRGTTLDIGCGPGYLAAAVRPNEAWYTGIDISGKAIELGKMLFPGATFIQHDAANEKLPFRDNQFMTVVCSELIEHTPDFGLLLSEIQRVSKSYMVLTVPVSMGGVGHVWPKWEYQDLMDHFGPMGKILMVQANLEYNFYVVWIRKEG